LNSCFAQDARCIIDRIKPPEGYVRVQVDSGGFAEWLRNLPLKPGDPPVRLFNGKLKRNQEAHCAVIDMDVGNKNLQQCADAIIRLRAEYLFSIGHYDAIHFNFTSGEQADFRKWIQGYRPVVNNNKTNWIKSAEVDSSYYALRQFLEIVMIYAGSYSLQKELRKVPEITGMRIGDVFIQGGFPGHAVEIVDMAVDTISGRKAFLLAQSFMPAQDIHILRSPYDSNPWYPLDFGDSLRTPEWVFDKRNLYRFEK